MGAICACGHMRYAYAWYMHRLQACIPRSPGGCSMCCCMCYFLATVLCVVHVHSTAASTAAAATGNSTNVRPCAFGGGGGRCTAAAFDACLALLLMLHSHAHPLMWPFTCPFPLHTLVAGSQVLLLLPLAHAVAAPPLHCESVDNAPSTYIPVYKTSCKLHIKPKQHAVQRLQCTATRHHRNQPAHATQSAIGGAGKDADDQRTLITTSSSSSNNNRGVALSPSPQDDSLSNSSLQRIDCSWCKHRCWQ
jgi:hypothetical protein